MTNGSNINEASLKNAKSIPANNAKGIQLLGKIFMMVSIVMIVVLVKRGLIQRAEIDYVNVIAIGVLAMAMLLGVG